MSKSVARFGPTAVFLLLPMLLAAAWGTVLPPSAYEGLAVARGQTVLGDGRLVSPLWLGVLALGGWGAWLHLSLPALASTLSALGWGVTAVLLHHTMRRRSATLPALLLPLLLVTSPLIPATLGTAVSWQTAATLWALIATANGHWRAQTAALLALLALSGDWPGILLVAPLLAWRWHRTFRLPWLPLLAGTAVAVTTAVVNTRLWGQPFTWPAAPISLWGQTISGLLAESELYLLFGLLAGSSLLLALLRQTWSPLLLLLWGEITLFQDGAWGAALLLLAGLLAWHEATEWLLPLLRRRRWRVVPSQLALILTLLGGLPLLLAHGSSLWQQYQARPVVSELLHRRAGEWLWPNVAGETVFGPPSAGYHAAATIWPWDAAPGTDWPALLPALAAQPPSYVVADRTLPWSQLTHTGWFQERYRPLQQFPAPSVPTAPVTVWAYQDTPFDEGELQPLQVHTTSGWQLTAYRYWPPAISPGEAVHLTLFWEPLQPLTANTNTIVRLIAPVDGVGWAQRDMRTPRSLPPAWIEPGRVFPERFVLTTTANIPVGAYQLNVSLRGRRDETFTQLYQDTDPNPLDRVQLGYVAVPWTGSEEPAVTRNGTFADQILLRGFTVAGERTPGNTLHVTLIWEALQQPEEDYTVFLHLLDGNGQYVTGHDSPPRLGTYATGAWLSEHIIPDEHTLTLPLDLSPGVYQLTTGLYLPATGVRLPAVDAAGSAVPNDVLPLGALIIE